MNPKINYRIVVISSCLLALSLFVFSYLEHTATNQELLKQRAEGEKNFREMRQQLDDLVNSGAMFPDKSKPAHEAIALALAAEKSGDINLAKIYYISAINHAPSEFSILKDYTTLVFNSTASVEDFDRLKSVIQISLYQIPPANISSALDLLKETIRRDDELLAAQTPKPTPVNWKERFEQFTKANPLEKSWTNLSQMSNRWAGLSAIIESLREEQSDSSLTTQAQRELELTQRVLAAVRLTTAIDTMIAALDSSPEQPEKAVSLLQTAEATLGQLWGVDSTDWPAALRTKVDQYAKDIQSRVEIVAQVKSRPFVKKLGLALADARNYKVGKESDRYQRALIYYDGCLSNAAEAAQKISSADGHKTIDLTLKEIREIALVAKQKQFDAYQKWAVQVCSAAYKEYDQWNWSQGKYMDAFDRTLLTSVDPSLLAPETARLFNDVVQKFFDKFKGDGEFWKSKDLAEHSKKKLEDF